MRKFTELEGHFKNIFHPRKNAGKYAFFGVSDSSHALGHEKSLLTRPLRLSVLKVQKVYKKRFKLDSRGIPDPFSG